MPAWKDVSLYGPQEAVVSNEELYLEVLREEPSLAGTLVDSYKSFLTNGKEPKL